MLSHGMLFLITGRSFLSNFVLASLMFLFLFLFLPDLVLYLVSMKEESVLASRWAHRARHNSDVCSSNQAGGGSPSSHLGDCQEDGLVHRQYRDLPFPPLPFLPAAVRFLTATPAQLSDRHTAIEVSLPH